MDNFPKADFFVKVNKLSSSNNLPSSIYDFAANTYWLSVTRYYSIRYSFRLMPIHTHNGMEIMYNACGKCTVNLEDGRLTLREGDYIFLDSMFPHNLYVEQSGFCRVLNVEFEISEQKNLMNLGMLSEDSNFYSFRQAGLPSFVCYDGEGIMHNSIANLHHLLQQKVSSMEIDFQLSLILLEMGRQYFGNSRKYTTGMPSYVKRALNYITNNFDQVINIDKVAEAAGVSKSHLQRTFHTHTGLTIVEKINELRLEKARFLLETSKLSIVDVANSVGFSSRQYFTDLFTKTIGMSPASYRKYGRGRDISEGHYDLWNT